MSIYTIMPITQSSSFNMLPVYCPTDFEYAQNKDNELSNIKTAILALTRFNHFLQSGRLQALLQSEFGFHQHHCQLVAAKQYDDVLYYNFPFISGAGTSSDSKTRQVKYAAIDEAFTSVIKTLESRFDVSPIASAKSRFVLPRGKQVTKHFLQLYPKSFITDLHALLTTLERKMVVQSGVFSVQQVLVGSHTFIDLVDGLIHPDDFRGIEPFVRNKLECSPEYFLLGYPNDLLVKDKRDIMNNAPVTGIYAKTERCSTRSTYKDSCLSFDDAEYPIDVIKVSEKLRLKTA